jgi:non-specific serine/threonine protein kinase
MYKIDLDTLSEDRLRRAVDSDTYNLGVEIFSRGQVQVLDMTELAAFCIVPDKRNYRVEIKIVRDHVYLKCSCSHASRGLICEHDVAAWLSLRQQLTRLLPEAWQSQLDQLIQSAQAIPPRQKTPPYLLFFSLQEEMRGFPSYWKLAPYSLPFSSLPAEMRQAGQPPDLPALQALVETSSDALRGLKSPYYTLDPAACLNCGFEAVNLANIILERNRAYSYSYNTRFPLEDYLRLLRNTQSPLFLGDASWPLRVGLSILTETGEIQLNLEKDERGLHLSPILVAGDQTLSFFETPSGEAPDLDLILDEPPWLLLGQDLIELTNPSGLGLLDHFLRGTSESTPKLAIPAAYEQNFIDRYLLELAQQFPLQGNAVTWEVVQLDPVPRLYLSDVNGELQAQLRFSYGEAEVRFDPDYPGVTLQRKAADLTLLRVLRQPTAEKSAYEALSASTFGLKRAALPSQPGLFRLRSRKHPVDFLLNSVPKLAEAGFEVYGEEQLRTARVNRNTPSISFKVSSGIDWFDVQAVVNFGELEVSLSEIRRAIRKRERYVKLADGSIGEIPEIWLERYKHLFALGETSEEGLRFSRHQITLLDQAFAEADEAQTDELFDQSRERMRLLIAKHFASGQSGAGIQPQPLPQGFMGELRPYQKAGFDWLHFLHSFEFGGCLADDMGLGKTVQTLTFLQSLYEQPAESRPPRASLLIVPRSLLVNWQRESARFTPNLRLLEFFETSRTKDTSAFDEVDLVITTYGVMLRDIQFLHGYRFYYAILDESQAIKNPLSQTARAAHLLQASHRLVLTGTPIENSTAELWSQFSFLNPGLLGSLQYFKSEFGLPIEKKNDEQAAAALRRLVYPFILRRTKDQVAPELPPRSERILYSDMEPAQRRLYNRTRDYFRGMVLGMLDREGLNQSRMKILEGLLRLRQISNHPALVEDNFHGESGKFELLFDTLETLRAEGHKALVFSQFVQMLALVRKELDARHIPYAYLDGQTTARQEEVDRFQASPEIPFFLISLKAGGLGLNLTAADYVIHIDPWWNPAAELQASDRTHRIGQEKPVFIFKLIARDSVEEKILLLQERKKQLVDQIITTESAFLKTLSQAEILALFEG